MSYILDALKRADAERGRGQVPGLNAQPLGASPEPSVPVACSNPVKAPEFTSLGSMVGNVRVIKPTHKLAIFWRSRVVSS